MGYPAPPVLSSEYFPAGVKWLLIAQRGRVSVHQPGSPGFAAAQFAVLKLTPDTVVHDFTFWQLFTYLFLHAGTLALIVNMLVLWMFGVQTGRTGARGSF